MKKLYTSNESSEIELLKGLVEQQNIECAARNEPVMSAFGPMTFCYPELWVLHDEDYDRAKEILDSWHASSGDEEKTWTCPHCGESIGGQFDSCWKCTGADFAVVEAHADDEEA